MALTITSQNVTVAGNLRIGVYTIGFDSSYPALGEALTASKIGLSEILLAAPFPNDLASAVYIYGVTYSSSSSVLLTISYPTGGAAPAALAAPAYTVTSGATAMTGSAATLAAITETAGRGIELADTTDASALTIRLFVVGK